MNLVSISEDSGRRMKREEGEVDARAHRWITAKPQGGRTDDPIAVCCFFAIGFFTLKSNHVKEEAAARYPALDG